MTPRGDLAVALVTAFGLGVGVGTYGYEMKEKERQRLTAEQVRTCKGYLVIALDGRTTECRMLMPRLDVTWPLPEDPVRLRRKEIKRAIGG